MRNVYYAYVISITATRYFQGVVIQLLKNHEHDRRILQFFKYQGNN